MIRIALREERTPILGWGIGLFLFMLMIGATYASIEGNADYDKIWEDLPDGAKEAFGGVDSITSVDGYLISQAGVFLPILIGTYLVMATTKRLAGAEENGRLDHLLARPISRTRFYWTIATATGIVADIVIVAIAAGSVLGFALSSVSGGDLLRVAGYCLDLLPVSIFWWGFGLFAGAVFHRRGPALGLAMGGLFGFFAVNLLGSLVSALSWLQRLTPYGLHARSDMFHGSPDLAYWLAMPLFGIALAFVGAYQFTRKNLY